MMFPEEDQKRRSEKSSKYYMVYLKMNKKSYEKAIDKKSKHIKVEQKKEEILLQNEQKIR